jgi:ComF family protein
VGVYETLFCLREHFFPAGCGGCGEALLNPLDANSGLCCNCREIFHSWLSLGKKCVFCGRRLISEWDTCLLCRGKGAIQNGCYNEHIVKLRTLFPYSGKFRSILASYKFGMSLGIGKFLSGFFPQALVDICFEDFTDTAWVPVPPRPGKIKNQGWDQIKYLAANLKRQHTNSAKSNSLPVYQCLKRLPSRSQKELNRKERSTNLKGRIQCAKKPPKTAVLFDDVITTGATLNECAISLLEGGAGKVYAVCLFYD